MDKAPLACSPLRSCQQLQLLICRLDQYQATVGSLSSVHVSQDKTAVRAHGCLAAGDRDSGLKLVRLTDLVQRIGVPLDGQVVIGQQVAQLVVCRNLRNFISPVHPLANGADLTV